MLRLEIYRGELSLIKSLSSFEGIACSFPMATTFSEIIYSGIAHGESRVTAVRFSLSGSLLATGHENGRIRVGSQPESTVMEVINMTPLAQDL